MGRERLCFTCSETEGGLAVRAPSCRCYPASQVASVCTFSNVFLFSKYLKNIRNTYISKLILVKILENKDYDAFESKYGETLRIVVESETTDTEFKNVRVEEEPMDYALNEYHMNIVFDNSLQILLHYDFNNDLYIPNYVNLMGGA